MVTWQRATHVSLTGVAARPIQPGQYTGQ